MADNKNLQDENDKLREQLRLLQEINSLQQESFDISVAAVDSLKELMGINSRRSTFESSTLRANKQIAQAILDQKTGLRDIESIEKQLTKNAELLNKTKVIENSISQSISKTDAKRIEKYIKLHNLQSDISKQLEAGDNLTKRQTSSLLKKLAANDSELENLQKQLGYNNTLLALTRINTQELEKQQKVREAEKAAVEDINKQLGFYPKLLSGLDKNLKRLGLPELGAKKAIDETYKLGQEAKSSGKEFKASGEFVGQLKNNIGGALTKANLLQWAITELILAMKSTDEGAGDMAKKMNLTYTEALRVRGELGTIAGISGDAALNTKNLQESYMAVGQALGSNAMLNQQDLITMTKLTKQAGFTHDELMGIEKLSLVNGKTLEQNTKEILGGAKAYASRNKLVLNEKQILREVNSASASLKLSLGGSAEQVAIAAAKAKQFGLNLEQAEKISQSLLNFESSIEAELSAELLTGKDLNLERARLLSLNGDIAGAAEEIANQVGKSSDFAKMNVIQQEALAKAAGMTKDELAQSLMDREALAKLSAVEGATAQEKFNNLVKQVGLEKAKKQLGDETLANQFAQQSIQERFNQSIEKLKEVFVQLAEPVLQIVSPFADLVSNVLPLINIGLQPVVAILRVISSLISGIVKLVTLDFKGAISDLSPSNMFKGYTDMFSAAKSKVSSVFGSAKPTTPVSDFSYSNQTGKTTISTKEGGLYSISPNDEIAVAPKINQTMSSQSEMSTKINPYNQPTTTAQPTVDLSAMVSKMEQMFAKLQDRPVVVHSVVKTENNDVLARGTNTANRKSYSIQ